jgi:formylglycine-generating enzyme required for sulfatase activity
LLVKSQEIYRSGPDPGLHAAAEWLLRRWKRDGWLDQVNKEWANDKNRRTEREKDIQQVLARDKQQASPQWYVNGQGQTMVVIPGPVVFSMGSPTTERDRHVNESQHTRLIPRSFVLAAAPVTKEQFLRFMPAFQHNEMRRYPVASCPIGGVLWSEAAAYCNWLSKEEGIAEDQWCYEIADEVTTLKSNHLDLTGYRLPTEAEMEYATRAGAFTARFFGEAEELLPKYAWYEKNSQNTTWPFGSLKPNDLGLFDVYGNIYTWCDGSFKQYPAGSGEPAEDREGYRAVDITDKCVLRGGSYCNNESSLRSAARFCVVPSYRNNFYGLRVARTFAP